ncbi:MAG: DUF2505 domain-containing protein [Propionibacterium sp.]|nr:DUF2505 domain-containing protein [Propionibacterium sp.]
MKLAFQQAFPATPDRVVDLLRNEEFIADVASHAGAKEHSARILADRTELDMEIPTPANVQSVIGKTVKLSLMMQFSGARSDGSIPGSVEVKVPGMPVEAAALGLLTPQDGNTVGTYDGELKVKIPLVGKRVEAQIEPFVVAAFRGIEKRAGVWLTR